MNQHEGKAEYVVRELPGEVTTDMRILLLGGGAGHIGEDLVKGLEGVKFPRAEVSIWAFNTDREDLIPLPENIHKILIGEQVTGGCGAGSTPENGLLAAQENQADFDAIIEPGEIVVFLACTGGGTGTSSISFAVERFKEQIKDQYDLSIRERRAGIVFITTPYEREDRVKHEYAKQAREALYGLQCPLIVIPNDAFLSNDNCNRTMREMNREGNQKIAQMLGRLIRSLGKRHNLYNIDRNDIISNLLIGENDMPESYCGVGYGKGDNALRDALEQAANNPLLTVELKTCKKAIIAIDCQDARESDQTEIHDFLAQYRMHTDADWRVGLNDEYEPLEFEKDLEAKAVVMILAVSSVPLEPSQEAAKVERAKGVILTSMTAVVPPPNGVLKSPRFISDDEVEDQFNKSLPPVRTPT